MSAEDAYWRVPAAHPELGAHEVHIWRSGLTVSAQTLDALSLLLSPDERERAGRFVFERERRHFTVARGVLRLLLAAYSASAPADLVFGYGPEGKPFLAGPPDDAGLAFNLAHSGDWAVYGFTRSGRIGVDVERHRDLKDIGQLAATVFSARELATWQALPAHQRQTAFYAGWTRKEAFVKALGAGLSFPLDRFDVALDPGQPPRVLEVRGDPAEAGRWRLVAFSPAPDLSGAVALDGQQTTLTFWDFRVG